MRSAVHELQSRVVILGWCLVILHHTVKHEVGGVWVVSRPLRDTSWWQRRKQERACRRRFGHCWHPEDLVGWWCCLCSAETDGMPPQRCAYCLGMKSPVHPFADRCEHGTQFLSECEHCPGGWQPGTDSGSEATPGGER